MKIKKEQIKLLIKKKSLKQKDVAVKIGVGPQDFNNWMFRGIFPHYNKLEELAILLDVDLRTLFQDDTISDPSGTYTKKVSFSSEELVPLYEIDPLLGLASLWSESTEMQPKDYIYIPGLNADFVLPYFGKGMESQLENGDWMVLRRISDLSFFNYGNIYAVSTKEQVIVRNLKKSKLNNHILLAPTVSHCDEIELPIKTIKTIFMVVCINKRNLI